MKHAILLISLSLLPWSADAQSSAVTCENENNHATRLACQNVLSGLREDNALLLASGLLQLHGQGIDIIRLRHQGSELDTPALLARAHALATNSNGLQAFVELVQQQMLAKDPHWLQSV